MKTTYTITNNAQFNSIEISFNGKPSAEVREALKALRFRWHGQKKVWYGYTSEEKAREAIEGAAAQAQEPAPLVIPSAKFVDGGGLYDGWEGGNNKTWRTDKELKALLLADFKRAGISASVRFNRAGYLTSITVTIKISAEDIKPFDEWAENFHVVAGRWNYYTNTDGNLRDIYGEQFYSLPEAEQAELFENIKRTSYKLAVERLTTSGNPHNSAEDVLTENGNRILSTVQAIVSSYNRDCSNSMVDYFDRDIYDNYTFKVA